MRRPLERGVLASGVRLAAIGVIIGTIGASFTGRLIESRLYGVDAAGNKSASSNTVTVSLPLDTQAPTVPTFSVTSVGTRHISLTWSSTDDSPWISYIVTKDGVRISSGWISATSRTFTLLQPGTTYTFTAQARDYFENVPGGNVSAVSAPFSVMTTVNDGSDVTPPTQPSSVWADLYGDGSTEMQVSWARPAMP